MPIFDFICEACHEEFEALVLGNKLACCPKCRSKNLKKRCPPLQSAVAENLLILVAAHNAAVVQAAAAAPVIKQPEWLNRIGQL
jgi:putative FmdB family regulatory protein